MSALPRLAVCPGSAALPVARQESGYDEAGTSRHSIVERAVRTGETERLPTAIRELMPNGLLVAAEVAVAYDYERDTARLLGTEARNYVIGETEIPGTIDLTVIDYRAKRPRVLIADWKGWLDVGAAERNEQFLGYALCAARIYEVDEIEIVVGHLEEVDDGTVRLLRPLERVTVDAIDLDGFAAKLRGIVAEIKRQQSMAIPDVRESKHCRWCDAALHCPAKTALVRRVLDPSASPMALDLQAGMEPARIGLMFERLRSMKVAIDGALSQIRSIAYHQEIPLPSGEVYRRVQCSQRRQLDGDVVHAVLVERHGKAIADAAMKYETSQDRIKAAVKSAAGVKSAEGELKTVIAIAQERGGVRLVGKTEDVVIRPGDESEHTANALEGAA